MFTWEIWCRYGSLKVGNSQIIWENIDGLFKFDQKLKNQRYFEFKAVFFIWGLFLQMNENDTF